jgi:hypothetical protein
VSCDVKMNSLADSIVNDIEISCSNVITKKIVDGKCASRRQLSMSRYVKCLDTNKLLSDR